MRVETLHINSNTTGAIKFHDFASNHTYLNTASSISQGMFVAATVRISINGQISNAKYPNEDINETYFQIERYPHDIYMRILGTE